MSFHVNSRINFLLDCRSLQLTPAFILHKTSKLNYQPQVPLASKVAKLRVSMLNEEIKSAFRTKAYLQRSLDRSADILQRNSCHWQWLHQNCKLIFAEELRSGQERLLKKLDNLSIHQHGRHLNLVRTRTYKYINWLIQTILKGVNVQNEQHISAKPPISRGTALIPPATSVSLDNTPSYISDLPIWKPCEWFRITVMKLWDLFASYKGSAHMWIRRVFSRGNLTKLTTMTTATSPANRSTTSASSQTPEPTKTQPRLVNLSHRVLDPGTKGLLEKGPNFAFTQKICPHIMNLVEVGIERAFYAVKWATHFEDKGRNNNAAGEDYSSCASDTNVASSQDSASVPHPRPTFRDSDVQQPPDVDPAAERKLEGLKSKIMKLYAHHKTQENSNVSSAVRMSIKGLKADDKLVIKQSDKCKGFVLMDRDDYVDKALSITDSYEKVEKNPTQNLEDVTKGLMRRTLTNKIPQDHLKRLLPQHARTAEFYELPKTHKPGNPLRPIVAACGDPLDKLSWFLQLIWDNFCNLCQLTCLIPIRS